MRNRGAPGEAVNSLCPRGVGWFERRRGGHELERHASGHLHRRGRQCSTHAPDLRHGQHEPQSESQSGPLQGLQDPPEHRRDVAGEVEGSNAGRPQGERLDTEQLGSTNQVGGQALHQRELPLAEGPALWA